MNTDALLPWIVGIGAILAMALVVVLGIVLQWPWITWQWLIGIVGGILLFAAVAGIIYWLNEDGIFEFYVSGTVVFGLCLVINFILFLCLRENYQVIFGCISVIELIGGVVLCINSFAEVEEGWGAVQIAETIIAVVLFVVTLIWL
jgi:hypothetical protein